MKNFIKALSERVLAKSGYRIADKNNVHDEFGLVERLEAAGFTPKTIIDVGVAHGTPYLYRGFPDAKFLLLDPTRENLPYMREWSKQIDASIYNIALGSDESKMTIHTRDTKQHATLLNDITKPTWSDNYDVEVKRFDSLDIEFERPSLVKIDVEGYELEVLSGMQGRARDIDLFIVETSLASLHESGADSVDVIAYMTGLGFRIVDIAGVTRRPLDRLIHQIDFVFANSDTRFYERAWS